jgi:hypothetical protein
VAGAGMSLAQACDLIIAADSTRFNFAYVNLGTCRARSACTRRWKSPQEQRRSVHVLHRIVVKGKAEHRAEEGQRDKHHPGDLAIGAGRHLHLANAGGDLLGVDQVEGFGICSSRPTNCHIFGHIFSASWQ